MLSSEIAVRKDVASDLIRRAGGLIVRRHDVSIVAEKSSPTDVATAVDEAVEELIIRSLLDRFPLDGIYSEEGSEVASSSGFTWIIDPLDGTANFIRDLRCSAVSIALAQNDVVVAGLVYDPYGNELYVGVAGHGATRNGVLLDVEAQAPALDRSFVGISGSNRRQPRLLRLDLIEQLIERTDSMRDIGSTALSLCWTAAGRFDAHIGIDVEWWDLAAGVVIAREAGCATLAFDGEQDPTPEGFVVARPSLLAELRDVLPVATDESGRQAV